tara:strand:+ start:27367 stop:27540 length:174 start_codon:yes stop_codon:yes gene_type:complete
MRTLSAQLMLKVRQRKALLTSFHPSHIYKGFATAKFTKTADLRRSAVFVWIAAVIPP